MSTRSLFDPGRHEPCAGGPWSEATARAAIRDIARDARTTFSLDSLWPAHPDDLEPGETGPHTGLYFGAAGVIWALDQLEREQLIGPGERYDAVLEAVETRNRAVLESASWRSLLGDGWQTRSLLFGDAAILYLRWKLGGTGLLDAIAERVEDNARDPSNELMWGAPGTMLVALALYHGTGEQRWAALYRDSAAVLIERFTATDFGTRLWTQRLYGAEVRYLGAVHGFAGCAFALIAGRDLLPAAIWARIAPQLAETLERMAVRSEAWANWPALAAPTRDTPPLVQHCHGAPGMINALAELDQPIDALLVAAGELIWAAGPLRKGAGLCHGTAGNGIALLKLFARTGDAIWLDRARAFAMHALAQSEAEAERAGQRRYSLWTGDLGLAWYLGECLHGSARFPTMDVL